MRAIASRAGLLAGALLASAGPALAGAQGPVSVVATANPQTLLFGDPVLVQVDVLLDAGAADPGSVELETDFRPLAIDDVHRQEISGEELTDVRFLVTLSCLEAGCLPRREPIELPPARVSFAGDGGLGTAEAPLAPLGVESRLTRDGKPGGDERWSYEARTLAPASYAIDPGLVVAALWIAAAGLVFVGGALAVYAITGRSPRGALTGTGGTPLERAMTLARRSAARAPAERRQALERLGRELDRAGHADLAEHSGALAWSRPAPGRGAIEAFLAEVERTTEAHS